MSLDVIPATSPEEYLALSWITPNPFFFFFWLSRILLWTVICLWFMGQRIKTVCGQTLCSSNVRVVIGRQCWFYMLAVSAASGLSSSVSKVPVVRPPFSFTAPWILPAQPKQSLAMNCGYQTTTPLLILYHQTPRKKYHAHHLPDEHFSKYEALEVTSTQKTRARKWSFNNEM